MGRWYTDVADFEEFSIIQKRQVYFKQITVQ